MNEIKRDGSVDTGAIWIQPSLFNENYDWGQQPNETINEEAQRLITGDRNSDYDHPLDNFGRIAAIWSVVFGIKVTPEQVGLAMVGVKVAREAYKPKRDNLVDGAGYFGTIQMVKDERERRERERSTVISDAIYESMDQFNDLYKKLKDYEDQESKDI